MDSPERKAQRLVERWRKREYLTSGAGHIHVHPIDLRALQEMIAEEIRGNESDIPLSSASVDDCD